jgi:hypothetical protein
MLRHYQEKYYALDINQCDMQDVGGQPRPYRGLGA